MAHLFHGITGISPISCPQNDSTRYEGIQSDEAEALLVIQT
jgi:hypothetical protein